MLWSIAANIILMMKNGYLKQVKIKTIIVNFSPKKAKKENGTPINDVKFVDIDWNIATKMYITDLQCKQVAAKK